MIFGSLTRPKHSIILAFDKIDPSGADEFFEKIEEVRKYYRFTSVLELVSKPRSGNAAIVFESPRKGVFLSVIPTLIAEKTPFTLILRSDCIGTNRIPVVEELQTYRRKYPEANGFLDRVFEDYLSGGLSSGGAGSVIREKLGPFPVEIADPLDFPVTWGKIRELPPQCFEVGVYVESSMATVELDIELKFIEKQLKRRALVALCERENVELSSFGIQAVVTLREGIVDHSTHLFNLPRFSMNEI